MIISVPIWNVEVVSFQTCHVLPSLTPLVTHPQYLSHWSFSICVYVCLPHWTVSSTDSRDLVSSFPSPPHSTTTYPDRILFYIKALSEFLFRNFLKARKLRAVNFLNLPLYFKTCHEIFKAKLFWIKIPTHITFVGETRVSWSQPTNNTVLRFQKH